MKPCGPWRCAALLQLLLLAALPWDAAAQWPRPRQTPSRDGEPCGYALGRPGACSNIYNCPEVLALVQKPSLSQEEAELLSSTRCGFQDNLPLVCCPGGSPPPSRPGFPPSRPNPNPVPSRPVRPPPRPATPPPRPATPPQRPPGGGGGGGGGGSGSFTTPEDVSNHPNIRMLPMERCGPAAGDRIIGGTVADLYAYPWMALVGYRSTVQPSRPLRYNCGGSLISERYVLTAAHCVKLRRNTQRVATVRLGEHTLDMPIDCKPNTESCLPRPLDIEVEQAIAYPFYDKDSEAKHHDIALLRLARRVDFTREEFVRPVCLPIGPENQNKRLENTKMVVAGWGTTENGESSKSLLDVSVPTVPLSQCGDVYRRIVKKDIIVPEQICAGGQKGRDSCTGDSGGPLMLEAVVEGEVKTVQFGVVSFGYQCALEGVPGVYTRISSYMQWVLDTIRP